ncbi:acyl-CoA dehydrogenase family protein [Aquimarina algiphila]|uniref:acyl-CoA dehydrogenase family protein n=1 Tax=Aquimarina algiphila TaxID=2047982 RepID=UPI00232F0CFD|nr:acyl-CoA dehydrogenase family protein [Aquimarina algiphila]
MSVDIIKIQRPTIFDRLVAVEELEEFLKSPFDESSVVSFKKSAALDENEIFPYQEIEELHKWRYNEYYIPEQLGGKLKSFEELLFLTRSISRRDLSISITDAHTLLGALPVWIAGSEEQKQELAKEIRNSRSACLAVTERSHGSDLNANGVCAVKTDDNTNYLLTGEKWPINKATLSDILCVLAKTNDKKDSRSLSILMVDKEKLSPDTYAYQPKINTLGIKGCDISGIVFNKAVLSKNMLVGKEGAGLEITLKGFQITRTLCAGLSLGAVDTALRTTLNFVLKRQLYGKTVFDIQHSRHTLAKIFIDIISCDCLAIASSRGLHEITSQFSVWSAIVKNYIPQKVEQSIHELSVILGSRFYFRDDHDHGVFQKMMRDNSIISLFDGSTIINKHSLSLQLKFLAKKRAKSTGIELEKTLENIFSLNKEVSDIDYNKLDLFSKGNNIVLQGIEFALSKLGNLKGKNSVSPKTLSEILNLTIDLISNLMDLENKVDKLPVVESGHNLETEYFDLAQSYCKLHTAATSVFMWVYNQEELGEYFSKGEWLVLSLQRTLDSFTIYKKELDKEYLENTAKHLLTLHTEGKLFSITPFQLSN